jgi:hypothetical protein
VGLWHVDLGECDVWVLVLQVHVSSERLDPGLDGVLGVNNGIDADGDLGVTWVSDRDRVNGELGIVDLVLDDSRHTNNESVIREYLAVLE